MFDVPFWVLSHVWGQKQMYWFRDFGARARFIWCVMYETRHTFT